jgi:hypothetical protein
MMTLAAEWGFYADITVRSANYCNYDIRHKTVIKSASVLVCTCEDGTSDCHTAATIRARPHVDSTAIAEISAMPFECQAQRRKFAQGSNSYLTA